MQHNWFKHIKTSSSDIAKFNSKLDSDTFEVCLCFLWGGGGGGRGGFVFAPCFIVNYLVSFLGFVFGSCFVLH